MLLVIADNVDGKLATKMITEEAKMVNGVGGAKDGFAAESTRSFGI